MTATQRWTWWRTLWRRGLVLEHPVWSWAVVAEAVSRASSYALRPPAGASLTPTTQRIEGALSYHQWSVVIAVFVVMIVVGTLRRWSTLAWAGHMVGIFVAGTLAISILSAAVIDGAGWSAAVPLALVGLVHLGRSNALGPRIRETAETRKQDRPETPRTRGGRRA